MMNVMKMTLSITDKDRLEEYPYCINLRLTEDGEIKFKFNHDNTTKIDEILKYNNFMNIWKIKGFRRFYINDNEGNTHISTIMEINDEIENQDKYFNNLASVFAAGEEIIENIPLCISTDALNYVENWNLKDIRINNEEGTLLDGMKEKLPKNVTVVKLYLINQQNQYIVSVAHLGNLSYLLDMGEFQIKTNNSRKNKKLIQELKNGDVDLMFEKYIFNVYPAEIYKEIKTMFYSTNKPLEKIISYVVNDKGQMAVGKIQINMSKKYFNYWHNEVQNVDIKVYICEDEVSKINEMNTLLQQRKYVQAIPLIEVFQHRNFASSENLAFAYCLNQDFNKSIELSERIISEDYKTIAHFTKGLALVMKGELEAAYISYMYGLNLISKDIWYPEVKNNLLCEIEKNGIEKGEVIKKILSSIELYNISSTNGKRRKCFCGSNRKFRDCHERKLIEEINTSF